MDGERKKDYALRMHNPSLRDVDGAPHNSRAGATRRIVLKLGSRLLTSGTTVLEPRRMALVAATVAEEVGTEVVIVSSGAVAAGFRTLGHTAPPQRIKDRQAAAAVGQGRLMSLWAQAFGTVGLDVAQVLLTNDCLTDRRRYNAAAPGSRRAPAGGGHSRRQ